jgi:MFS family permease
MTALGRSGSFDAGANLRGATQTETRLARPPPVLGLPPANQERSELSASELGPDRIPFLWRRTGVVCGSAKERRSCQAERPGPQNKSAMTPTTPATQSKIGALGPAVVPLLAVAVFINYVDRGNLATAAPLIKDQLRLSSTQIGVLLSAFFWSYVPAQILAGWLAERINPYRTLAIGLAIWSIATALCGVATGFATLIALRIVLGLGESAAFPCSSKLLAQHLPSDKLGGANGLIGVGMALGPALGTFVGGLLIAQIGWRNVFILFGLVSLLWLVPWYASTRRADAQADNRSIDLAPSLTSIIRRRELWGAGLGHFCSNYAFYFVISWLPLYLVKARGLSVGQMAEIGGLIYIVYAASSFSAGRLSDRWIRGALAITVCVKRSSSQPMRSWPRVSSPRRSATSGCQ